MRISLDQNQGKQKSRGRRRRRTYETEIAQPVLRPGRRTGPRTQSDRATDRRRRPPSKPQVTSNRPGSPQIEQWRIVLARLPVALVLAALIASFLYLSLASEFFIYGADISGNRYLDRQKVYEASGVHEQNIFWIQPSRAADEIAKLDGIKSAQVHCSLPAKVTIDIVERRPIVLWRAGDQGKDFWLDEDGIVLPYGEVLTNTVFVVESSERQLNVGDSMEPEGIVHSVQQLAASLPEVTIFYYQEDRGLSFTQTTAHGSWPVYVGDSQDLVRKIQVVRSLTNYFAERKMNPAYIDVRWADYPVYGRSSGRANQVSN